MSNIYQSSNLNGIGILNESSLHKELKEWYREPGDKLETPVDGYIIDIVRKDLLIEIQTQNFAALRKKIMYLTKNHKVLLVYPIISDKWILYNKTCCSKVSKRLSPKHCNYNNIFDELIYIPNLLSNENLSIQTILIQVEEIRQKIRNRSWTRKGWTLREKKLVKVKGWRTYHTPYDFLAQLPWDIDLPFSNYDLAKRLNQSISLTRKMTYCLRKMGILQVVGKRGNILLLNF